MPMICSKKENDPSQRAIRDDPKRKALAQSGYRLVGVTVVSTSPTHLTLRAMNRTTKAQVQFVLEWDDPNLWHGYPSTLFPASGRPNVGDSGELLIHHSVTDQGWLDLLGIHMVIDGATVPKWPKGA